MSTPTSTPERSGCRRNHAERHVGPPALRQPRGTDRPPSSRSTPSWASGAWRCFVRRHEADPVSLAAGLLFLAVAVVHIAARSSDTDLSLRWMVPIVLVLLGVLGLLSAVRSPHSDPRPSADADASTRPRGPASATSHRARSRRWRSPRTTTTGSRSPATSPRSSRRRPIGDLSGVRSGPRHGRLSCLPPSSRPLSGRRHPAGCPSGQWERTVNPSAKPTKVRILHLPPTRGRDCWQSRPRAYP